MEAVHALTPAILLLVVGVLAIVLTRPLGLSPIVGYLLAGLAIGPHALGLVPENDTTHLLAELGVVFLLFDIGLHFSLSNIWEARRDIFGLGPLQILLTGGAFGGIAFLLGLEPAYAVLIGGALALSSTAVVVKTLAERGQQNCPVGRTATAVLIFQDILAIFLLVLAASMAGGEPAGGDRGLVGELALALVNSVLAFAVAFGIGRFAIRPLFNLLSRTKNTEVFTAMALLVVLTSAAATGAVGLSLTLGAFLAGMMIAETPYRLVVQTEASPFRDLLLAFFFITVGMSLDWRILLGQWGEILLFVVGLMLVKALMIGVAARVFGWSRPGSVQLGSLLAQGSEFVFAIIAMATVRQTLGEEAVGVMVAGVAASLALTPTAAALGNKVARALRKRSRASVPEGESTPLETSAPVVIFGMREIGRTVADALEANQVPYDAVEMDYDRFLAASADGYPVAFGDLGDVRLMETFEPSRGRAVVVVTIVRYELSKALDPIVSERYPNTIRFVTVDHAEDEPRFRAVGMRPVVNRSYPPGLDLAAAVLRSQDIDEERIGDWMRGQQERALAARGGSTTAPTAA